MLRARTLLLLAALAGTVAVAVVPDTAMAQDPNAAEALRLREEMKKLAAKNAWAGVERSYDNLMKLPVDKTFDDHFLGSQAAKYQGKTWEMYERLSRAKEINAKPEIVSELEAMDGRYGRVDIQGTFKVLPTVDVVMPFSPDERKSIEWAQKVLSETGSFKGMLPIDIEYKLNGAGYVVPFTPKAGPDWLSLDLHSVGNWKKASSGEVAPVVEAPTDPVEGGGEKPPKPSGGGGVQGPIDTAGPVVMLGYSFLSSGQPGAPSEAGPYELNDGYEQPADMAGSGAGAELGAEVVLTGKKFAVSGTVGYAGMIATDDYAHGFRGWLAGSYRPGNARISFGPTYGVIVGKGIGLADWYEGAGQDQTAFPNERLPYLGRSLAGGVQLTAGYGFLEMGSLMGLVEVGGSWQTDGTRSYVGAGARVGVVPWIKRFKG